MVFKEKIEYNLILYQRYHIVFHSQPTEQNHNNRQVHSLPVTTVPLDLSSAQGRGKSWIFVSKRICTSITNCMHLVIKETQTRGYQSH